MRRLIFLTILLVFAGLVICQEEEETTTTSAPKRKFTTEEKNRFKAWELKYGRTYDTPEAEEIAMEHFLKNRAEINEHNILYEEGESSFRRGTFKYSDLTEEEKEKYMTGISVPPEVRSAPVDPAIPQFPPGPDRIDWREHGLVGPVLDQGWCLSCWAFSATGVIEAVLRKKNITETVSPQQLVDCAKKGCWGCNTGWPKYALDYAKSAGVSALIQYPYTAKTENCTYTQAMNMGYINRTYNVATRGNETWLRDIVASVGPVSIVMCSMGGFYNYKSGIYYEPGCCTGQKHAMLIVGYDTDPIGGDYWIVKNSWGTSWGEKGYVRMARNRDNNCNIAYYAVYAT